MAISNENIFDVATYNLAQTVERLNIADAVFARIASPQERIEVTLNPTLNNGKSIHIRSFVVRHNDALGPAKGGIRMTPTVTLDDVTGLAMEMTWKTSLIGVPFGGGKSGICREPKDLDADSKEIVIRSFTRGLRRHIGPEIYIPAPDMGTTEGDMGHVRDCIAYSSGTSITNGCFVTGKPVILGGIVGRREATGKGVVYSILTACEKLGIDIKGASVAIHGFGNVASAAAAAIVECGAKVIAIADITGGLRNDMGIDIEKLSAYVNDSGQVKGFDGAQGITNEDVLTADCDILIPAATQSVITVDNADKIKAKIVAEGANSPTTPQADEILTERKVFVIPDILCNAGGVFVSYLEYTQETQREQMTLQLVNQRLSERMKQKFNEVYNYAEQKKLTMRKAAMDIAVSRVVEGIQARGLLP